MLLERIRRHSRAGPLMRRHLGIFVSFTVATGHQHSHLQAAVGNYHGLLEKMGLAEAEVGRRGNGVLRPIRP